VDSFVLQPYGQPGSSQHYSSTNYLLLTAIIEKVTSASVPAEIDRRFLTPLRLTRTVTTKGEPLPAHLTAAHPWVDADEDGDLDDLAGTPVTWISTLSHPAMFTTPADLVRWIHALYHERSILSEGSLQEMLTYPEVAVPDPEGGRYGLGVVDFTRKMGMKAIGHAGSAMGYTAVALYLREYGISLAWMVNTGEGPHELAGTILGDTWLGFSRVLRKHARPLP
jgi:CubicO group peptidase (beta-lactamase class C family)